MTDSAAVVAQMLNATATDLMLPDGSVGLRVPTDPDLPFIRFEVAPGPGFGPVRPLTVMVQVYATTDGSAARVAEAIWAALDGTAHAELPSVTGLLTPRPFPDPDRPALRRWQLTLSATHVTL